MVDDGRGAADRRASSTRYGTAAHASGQPPAGALSSTPGAHSPSSGRPAQATARAGLDPATFAATVDAESERLNAVIEASQEAQRAAGHYGVPMIAFNNEPFFGQDRFDQFKWRLEQQGLAKR